MIVLVTSFTLQETRLGGCERHSPCFTQRLFCDTVCYKTRICIHTVSLLNKQSRCTLLAREALNYRYFFLNSTYIPLTVVLTSRQIDVTVMNNLPKVIISCNDPSTWAVGVMHIPTLPPPFLLSRSPRICLRSNHST